MMNAFLRFNLILFMIISFSKSTLAEEIEHKSHSSLWSSVWDEKINDVAFKKVGASVKTPYTIQELVDILNTTLFLGIEVVGQKAETLMIKINQAEDLTQHMGSSGARTCLGIITFTLTENSRVKKVEMDFEFGSHASPGTYSRADFIQAF
ncbi:hypothetical protein K5X82_14285 [Halosquirtibacter xylanolyticus]|uniref:hypothetical protein n=1 Tax=Halosquirtibacter xylanolyticus TaxID=3374599 RepID=UPI003749D4CE|nr:hypothetical protein K5X82_14285 [Prolixibacteraceae bacterium]